MICKCLGITKMELCYSFCMITKRTVPGEYYCLECGLYSHSQTELGA